MSTETTKRIVREHYDRFNARDLDGLAALASEDCVNHSAIPQAQGRAGMRSIVEKLWRAFPDQKMTVDDIIAEGDKVVCRVTVTGTHTGKLDFVKLQLPPTGKPFKTTSIHIFRIADGRIVERWAERDDVGMMQQLGLMPQLLHVKPEADARAAGGAS
jgi:steroid delta-isomerase-like uncharacterized protein